jgi:HPt (histidine-containing phosphotransfer) domain-containing protein
MEPLIDRERVVELERLMKEPLAEIVGELVQSMNESIERARQAIQAEDLEMAARAAHRCRNDALIVGAGPLQRALGELEAAARGGERAAAADALGLVEEAWSMTRPELGAAAQAG